MSKLNKDWDFFCNLTASGKYTRDEFLIVVIYNLGEEIPNIRIQSSILKNAVGVEILLKDHKHLDYEGIEQVINELNSSEKIKYILLAYRGKKDYANLLCGMLKQSRKLMRQIPQIVNLPHATVHVTNPAY